jgi:hypothetical protein
MVFHYRIFTYKLWGEGQGCFLIGSRLGVRDTRYTQPIIIMGAVAQKDGGLHSVLMRAQPGQTRGRVVCQSMYIMLGGMLGGVFMLFITAGPSR